MVRLILVVLALCISGCATNMTMTGKSYDPVPPLAVKILFKSMPKCVFEELAFISTPWAWSQNRAVGLARERAAEVGADYLVIEAMDTNLFNDVQIRAVAYKCASVDRDKVAVSPK